MTASQPREIVWTKAPGEDLERAVVFVPAWDRRSNDPVTNMGQHCVEIRFLLRGEAGTVCYRIFTHWYLGMEYNGLPCDAGISYHQETPEDENDHNRCDLNRRGHCHCDVGFSAADGLFEKLVWEGDSAVWEELRKHYERLKR